MEKKLKSWIYKIVSPSGKIYIGQTIDLKARFTCYKCLNCKKQLALYNSFKKYGFHNHTVEVIFEGFTTQKQLDDLEINHIKFFNSFKKGLNQTEGGLGSRGRLHSIEAKLKIGEASKNRIPDTSARLKMSIARKGKKKPIGFGEKVSKGLKGKKKSSEHIAKMSASQKGKIPFNRKAVQDTLTGVVYINAKIASETLGFKYGTFRGLLVNISKPRFIYLDQNNYNNSKGKKVHDIKTKKVFINAKQCADELGINYSTLKSKLNGGLKNETNLRYA